MDYRCLVPDATREEEQLGATVPCWYSSITKANAHPKCATPTKQTPTYLSMARSTSMTSGFHRRLGTGAESLWFLLEGGKQGGRVGKGDWLASFPPAAQLLCASWLYASLDRSLSSTLPFIQLNMAKNSHLSSREPPSPGACFSVCDLWISCSGFTGDTC